MRMLANTLPAWQDITTFYDNLTLHIVPGPRSASYFVPFVLMILALLMSPESLSHRQLQWLVLPSYYAIQIYVWIHHNSFDVISMNGALLAFMLLGWYDIRRDFRYVQRGQLNADQRSVSEHSPQSSPRAEEKFQEKPTKLVKVDSLPYNLESYPTSYISRLRWIVVLLASMRMTDWQIGMPSHDSRQPSTIKSFTTFALETISQGIIAYVLLDFTTPYMIASECGSGSAMMTGEYLQTQVVRSLLLLVYFYAALSLFTALLPHLLSVGALLVVPSLRLNSLTSPLTWPGHFGPLSSIYSPSGTLPSQNLGLRAFWGVFWHQNMRFITSTPGVALASFLGLRRGSKARYLVIVISSFFWSGVVHMGVVPPEPVGTKYGCWSMRFRIASFFWLQVIGIAIEDAIQTTMSGNIETSDRQPQGNKTTSNRDKSQGRVLDIILSFPLRAVIVLWTTSFLAFTAWWTILPVACEMGWLNIRLLPVSLARHLGVHML